MKRAYRPKYDVKIPTGLLTLMYSVPERMTRAETAVLLDLVQWGAARHEVPLSLTQMMLDCGISRPTACGAMQRLQERGVIQRADHTGAKTPALVEISDGARAGQYTQIPKAAMCGLFELLRGGALSYTAIRLLLFVWRNTFGYRGRKGDINEPRSHFSDSFIMGGTGIPRQNIHPAIKELVKVGAIRFNGNYGQIEGDYELFYRNGWGVEIKKFTAQSDRFERSARDYLAAKKWEKKAEDFAREDCAPCEENGTPYAKNWATPCHKNLTSDVIRILPPLSYKFNQSTNEKNEAPETLETIENTGETAPKRDNITGKILMTQNSISIDYVYRPLHIDGLAPESAADHTQNEDNGADEKIEEKAEEKQLERKPITAEDWLTSCSDDEKAAMKAAVSFQTSIEQLQAEDPPTEYSAADLLRFAEQHGGRLQGFEKSRKEQTNESQT